MSQVQKRNYQLDKIADIPEKSVEDSTNRINGVRDMAIFINFSGKLPYFTNRLHKATKKANNPKEQVIISMVKNASNVAKFVPLTNLSVIQ